MDRARDRPRLQCKRIVYAKQFPSYSAPESVVFAVIPAQAGNQVDSEGTGFPHSRE